MILNKQSLGTTPLGQFVDVMLDLCSAAYEYPPSIVAGHSELRIEAWHGYTVFACRGTTKNFSDILADISALPTYHKRLGWVHRGFLGEWGIEDKYGALGLWPAVKEWVVDAGAENCIFIGHSKGGGEATGLAALASIEFEKIAGLITCGCPRVGFSLEKKINAKTIIRLVNGNDLVPRHPYPIWGYRHVTNQIHIGGEGFGNRFVDHKIAHYINAWRVDWSARMKKNA